MTLYFILHNNLVDYICTAENLADVEKKMSSKHINASECEIREIWNIPAEFFAEAYFHTVASAPIQTTDYVEYILENIRDNFALRANNGVDTVSASETDGTLDFLSEKSEYLWEVCDPEVLEEFKEYLVVESPVYCTSAVVTPMELCITFF